MNVTVSLYKYTNKPIIVDKSSHLGTATTVQSDNLTEDQDVENPVILYQSTSEPQFNYAYIKEYHRYYFITQKNWVGGNVWSFTLHVDELYTYKTLVYSLSGIVAYSSSGSPLKHDKRLVYNKPPVRTSANPDSTIKKPSQFYVVMPTVFFNSIINTYTPKNNLRYYIFPMDTFARFLAAYSHEMTQDSQKAIAAGKLIQQLSLVTWLDANDFLYYEHVTTGYIRFDSPEENVLVGGGTVGGWNFQFDPLLETSGYYIAYDETVHRGLNLSWRVYNSTYWTRTSMRTIVIPYVGTININLDDLGVGETTDMYVGVNIRYDFSSGSYVLIPGVGSVNTGSDNFDTIYYTQAVTVPNMYATPFIVDTSYQYYNETMGRQGTALIHQSVQGIMQAVMSQGLLTPVAITGMLDGVNNYRITSSMLKYQQASSLMVQGSTNGGSPDSVLVGQEIDLNNNVVIVYPGAYMDTVTLYPTENYASFWADHGMPDGAYRTLSAIGAGNYVQMQEFEMEFTTYATKGEMDRLEAQLYQGVIL